MIKILLLIFAILAVSVLGFRVSHKMENKLENNRLQTLQERLEQGGECDWDDIAQAWICT